MGATTASTSMTEVPTKPPRTGLRLLRTPGLQSLLEAASRNPAIPDDVRSEATDMLSEDTLLWRRLRHVYLAVREVDPDVAPLTDACGGGGLALISPQPRQKSPQLLARLAELQRLVDQQDYDRMVHDVTVLERAAKEATEGAFVTYKQQLGFGVHVLVMMGTFYALGHTALANISSNPTLRPIGGLIGMMCAMLLETVLFILRTNPHELKRKSKKASALPAASPAQALPVKDGRTAGLPLPSTQALLEDKQVEAGSVEAQRTAGAAREAVAKPLQSPLGTGVQPPNLNLDVDVASLAAKKGIMLEVEKRDSTSEGGNKCGSAESSGRGSVGEAPSTDEGAVSSEPKKDR